MDLDTRHLRALVAVVDEGTFTDAAIALLTSQASVSRSVQRLEATVGQTLLARSSRHVACTPVGERVVDHARRILAALDQLEASVVAADDELLVGFAWAALGEHTVTVQRGWGEEHPGKLTFVQSNTPTAGLLEGRCVVAVLRRAVTDPRLDQAEVGSERRYAALPTDHPLASRTTVRLADLVDDTVAVDDQSGTTTASLWEPGPRPAGFRTTDGIDEWLTVIASGQAIGISSEATLAQFPRPGVVFRLVEDAPPITVRLAWRKHDPPPSLDALLRLARQSLAPA